MFFQNYSKEVSQKFSLFVISRKNLAEAVNKLTKIVVVGMKKAKITDLQYLMKFLPLNAQNWYDQNVFAVLTENSDSTNESDSDDFILSYRSQVIKLFFA